jgi:iron complex transport system substrate-binding protein
MRIFSTPERKFGLIIFAIIAGGVTYSGILIAFAPPSTNPNSQVNRIISLAPACTEIIYALGAEDKLVGVDQSSLDYANSGTTAFGGAPGNLSYYPEDVPRKPCVGKSGSPSKELIVSLDPDLVFVWYYYPEVITQLTDLGINTIIISPKSIADVMTLINTIGTLVGKAAAASGIVQEIQDRIEEVETVLEESPVEPSPKVYYELNGKGKTVNASTFTGELMLKAGGANIAANNLTSYPTLGDEYMVEAAPEIIVVVSYGASIEEIKARETWAGIPAIVNDKVYEIESGWVTASPRLILGLEQFAQWFHPALFPKA